jgi:hypothetical protein
MKIIVPNNKPKEEVIQTIDRSIDDLLRQSLPVKLTVQQRTWQGSTLTFAVSAKIGFVNTPIKGSIEVTDTDLIIDVDLGMLSNFVSDEKARAVLVTRVRGLLK